MRKQRISKIPRFTRIERIALGALVCTFMFGAAVGYFLCSTKYEVVDVLPLEAPYDPNG